MSDPSRLRRTKSSDAAPGSSGSGRDRRSRVQLEIQFHPADIHRPLHTYFLTPWRVVGLATSVLLLLTFLVVGIAGLPWAVRAWLVRHDYEQAVAERGRLGQRLHQLVARLDEIHDEARQQRERVERVYVVYGLDNDREMGQGGYPAQPIEELPPSIYRATLGRGAALAAEAEERVQVLATFLDEIAGFERAHGDLVRSTPSINPLRGGDFVLTSPFGYRHSPFTGSYRFHAGLDLAAPTGTPILAPAEGEVVFAGRYPLSSSVGWWRYGNLVAIRHGERFTTLFGHCDEIHVARGQRVQQGQVIATVGNTGWSTSPHLHYEVRLRQEDGEHLALDPRIYILDQAWSENEERLVRSRSAPDQNAVEPLPPTIAR